jgi:serine/threonine-protein kinase
MAPEQLLRESVSREADLYSAAIVLWEMLANRKLYPDTDFADRIARVGERAPPPLADRGDLRDAELDAIVVRALSRDPYQRYPTGEAMASALRAHHAAASSVEVAKWLATTAAADDLEISEERVRMLERTPAVTAFSAPQPPLAPTTRRRNVFAIPLWLMGAVVAAFLVFFGVRRLEGARAVAAPASPSISAAVADAPSAAPSASTPLTLAATIAPPSATVVTSAPTMKPAGKAPRHAAKSQCDPPYTVDSNGFKHYNRACF